MGRRGAAKQGRVPMGRLPYGYRIGHDGRPQAVEEQAETVLRIFHMYVHQGMGSSSIAVRLTEEGIPTQTGKLMWRPSYVHHVLGNATYTGTLVYGRFRHISTQDGTKVYNQPKETWIEIPFPRLVDDESWDRAQKMKKQRSRKSKRNTKVLYLLQHLLRCGECGHNFYAKSIWSSTNVRNGKRYRYDLPTPRRYYMCNGMQSLRMRCREKPYIPAEQLEESIWSEVKRVIQNPDLLVAGIDPLDSQERGGLEADIARAERDLRSVQMEDDRAITLFVSGKITEAQLDHQRKFITERLESVRARLDQYRDRAARGVENLRLVEAVFAWARDVGQNLDALPPVQRKEFLQMVVEEVIVDRNNNVDTTLVIPIESEPTRKFLRLRNNFRTVFSVFQSTEKGAVLVGSRFGSSRGQIGTTGYGFSARGRTRCSPRMRLKGFPRGFPQRLERFREESGLSWEEMARRLWTYPYTIRRLSKDPTWLPDPPAPVLGECRPVEGTASDVQVEEPPEEHVAGQPFAGLAAPSARSRARSANSPSTGVRAARRAGLFWRTCG